MKKLLFLIAAALLALLTCFSVCAEKAVCGAPGDTDISVCAKYVDNTGFPVIPTDENGNGSTTLPGGTRVSVRGVSRAKGRIVVEEVADKQALDWIAAQLGDRASGAKVYHIYLLDDQGGSAPAEGVEVTIIPEGGAADSVYAIGSDRAGKLHSTVGNGGITFAANGTDFYALYQTPGNAPAHRGGFPLMVILPIAGGCLILFLLIFLKKRKKTEK